MSTETTPYRIQQILRLRLLAGAETTICNYKKLVALATELGEQYEVERLARNLTECEADADELRDQLTALGYTPE